MLHRLTALLFFCVLAGFGTQPGHAGEATATLPAATEAAPEASDETADTAAAETEQADDTSAAETDTGDAPAEEATGLGALMKLIASGEEVGLVIIALSVFAAACTLERLINLRRERLCPSGLPDEVQKHLLAGDIERATAAAARHDETIAGKVLGSIVTHRSFAFEALSTIAGDLTARELRLQMNRAYPILVVATIAPLLGLLGTVIGMIGSFKAVAMAGSMGDPSIMAGDISFALVTTAMGLVVAVPCLAAYHFFRSRTQFFSAMLDEEIGDVINMWNLHLMQQNSNVAAQTAAPAADATNNEATSEAKESGDA
ncbi:MAG: MotA/TolQ/ExbB proton channel family protein [Planctomycetota bacterium]|jgi:biopolymer transport protein ExbB|nr:MotA/TolQ/ExbB proton channel family protein [Planctomycetota bacterium]